MKHWKEAVFGLGLIVAFAFPQTLAIVFGSLFLLSITIAILDRKKKSE